MTDLPDGPTERSTERDGFLSYAAEWHAFSLGFYHGLRSRPGRFKAKTMPDNPDVTKEPHYYAGAYVLGSLLQLVAIAVGVGYSGVLPV